MKLKQEQKNQRSKSCDSDERYIFDDEVDPYAEAIPFKRGDQMETIPPTTIG